MFSELHRCWCILTDDKGSMEPIAKYFSTPVPVTMLPTEVKSRLNFKLRGVENLEANKLK